MNRTIWTVTRATVDDVLFRTKPSQIRKKTKSDNSCLVGEVDVTVTLPDGRKKTERQKCYGVIKKFILHFMYPPPWSKTYKLSMRKLAKIDIPWILCAECEWYETLGVHPKTGLTRIQPNSHWDFCPLHNMSNTIPVNVAFWPEEPFDPAHFDGNGVPLSRENIENGKYDFSGLTSVCNVIHV